MYFSSLQKIGESSRSMNFGDISKAPEPNSKHYDISKYRGDSCVLQAMVISISRLGLHEILKLVEQDFERP